MVAFPLTRRGPDVRNLLMLAVLWLAAVVLIDPRGEFPTTDDWAYLASVRSLVETGRLNFSDWAAANFLTHYLWGALFAWPLGVSYFAVRLSTIVAALLGATALYLLLRSDRADPRVALLGAGVMLFNPLSMALSFGFMSDIGFTAAEVGAVTMLATAALSRSRARAAAGWVLALAALLNRQIGITIPLGWGMATSWAEARPSPWRHLRHWLPLVLLYLVNGAFAWWLRVSGNLPAFFNRQSSGILTRAIEHPIDLLLWTLKLVPQIFYYTGALTIPLTIVLLPTWLAMRSPRKRIGILVAFALGLAVLIALSELRHIRFPSWRNSLWVVGIGADLPGRPAPDWLLTPLTWGAIASGMAASLLIAHSLWQLARRGPGRDLEVAALAAGVALPSLLLIMTVEMRFDRYLIPVMPLLIVIAARAIRDRPMPPAALRVGAVTFAVMAYFTVAGAHDMLAAKRVDYRAYAALTKHVPAPFVNAGWVINATRSFGHYGQPDALDTWYMASAFLVGPETWPEPDFRTIASYPVDRWLPWQRGTMPILIRKRVRGCPVNRYLFLQATTIEACGRVWYVLHRSMKRTVK